MDSATDAARVAGALRRTRNAGTTDAETVPAALLRGEQSDTSAVEQALRAETLPPDLTTALRGCARSWSTLNALRAIAQRYKGIAGRKAMLWITGTVPFYPDPVSDRAVLPGC